MRNNVQDKLAMHDEIELIEIGDVDAFGGTTSTTTSSQTCIGSGVALSIAFCPTGACSSKCGT